MKSILITLSLTFLFLMSHAADKRPDPNLNKTANKSTVLAPGCTEFVHPCSGQASTVLLNDSTNIFASKAVAPVVPNSTRGSMTK